MKRLLGFLLLCASFAFAQDVVFSPQAIVVNPRPSFEVDVFLDKGGNGGQIPTYEVGEDITIGVTVSADSYVYLFSIRSDGQVQQILPNRLDEPGRNNFVRAGETKYFPPRGARYAFTVEPPRGLDKVIAVASRTQLDTNQLAQFRGEGDFATSSIGEESFARTLSIVVRPINQQDWVTDTALFYVGQRPAQAAFGTLRVNSSPSGAEVYVDGEFVGYAPVDYGTRPGRHEVRVEQRGYDTYRETVNLRPGDVLNIDARLRAQRRTGSVTFQSSPRGAEVYVDGRFLGTTPTQGVTLDSGSYQARFVLPGHEDAYVNFNVGTGQQTVSANLRSLAGSLRVQANVGGAQVFVNGVASGVIPSGSGVLTISDLSSGTHEITVVAPGYNTFVSQFRVRAGETTDVRVRQERR